MIRIEIEADAVAAALGRMAEGMDDMTDPMNDIGEFLVRSTKQRFGQGVAPDGTPWAPNSPVTLARKTDPRPLFGESKALSSGIFHEAGPDQVEIGSPMVYAGTQQFGAAQGQFGQTSRNGPIPWGDIPARPFLGLSEEDGTAILDIIDEWLDGLADAAP